MGSVANAAPQRAVAISAKTDRSTLNVAAAEVVVLTAKFTQAGRVSVVVIDRDGYVVRTLANAQPVPAGGKSFRWDARDDSGAVVPDEAYSFRIDWRDGNRRHTYFPADGAVPMIAVDAQRYDRRTATLSYTLSEPSRVHIQAGTAGTDRATKELVGPVMKTVVNRQPRAAGAIAEHWGGYDESGTIFVPDLEDFVVAIAVTRLPENSVITYGNRDRRFVDTLSTRGGTSLFTSHGRHQHHVGLRTEDDISPTLKIEPLNAIWSAADRTWITADERPLRVRLSVEGPGAAAFQKHPATVEVFVDGFRIGPPLEKKTTVFEIPIVGPRGMRRISVNWNSAWGPVAANTIQVRVSAGDSIPGGAR